MTKLTHQILVASTLVLQACAPHHPGDPGDSMTSEDSSGILTRTGARVRAERERQGLSQDDLARLTDLHRTYIGGVERGERNIGLLNLSRIARALGVTVGSLADDVDDPA